MRFRTQLRFLTIYSAVVTLLFAGLLVYAGHVLSAASEVTEFDRIRVHRIDVVEPDGTPRLLISNRSAFPGELYRGKESKRTDRSDSAGMLFINDEGTEDGGLIFGGAKVSGQPSSFSHLSFDQYEQDQTVVLGTALEDGRRTEGIQLNDAPLAPITPAMIAEATRIKALPHGAAREQAWSAFRSHYPSLTERAALSRSDDGQVGLVLRDIQGRSRLELNVSATGTPSIRLLDEAGKVQKQVSLDR
jgi:hypothetical protein